MDVSPEGQKVCACRTLCGGARMFSRALWALRVAALMCGRVQRGWRLAIVEQPESEFYKDEGGKNHALEVTLELQNVGHAPLPDIPADQPLLPLRASLYYESEERVEEDQVGQPLQRCRRVRLSRCTLLQQDILRILAPRGDAFAIDFDSLRVHIRYRIEKVCEKREC